MGWLISRYILILGLLFIFYSAPESFAFDVKCVPSGENDPVLDEDYTTIDASEFSTCFNDVFIVKVSWDPKEDPPFYPLSEIKKFAKIIVGDPDEFGDCILGNSLADSITQYLGDDLLPDDYPDIKYIMDCDDPPTEVTQFTIKLNHLYDSSYGNSSGEVILGFDQDPSISVWRLARVLFAHEWGHVCHYSSQLCFIAGQGCAMWHGASEFVANSAEFYAGKYEVLHNEDPQYTIGFGEQSWKEQCWERSGGGATEERDINYEPFTSYMTTHLDAGTPQPHDDGLSVWVTDMECDPLTTAKFDFASLSEALYIWDTDAYFESTSGEGKLQELFREYVLALWVNSTSIDEDVSVFLPGHEGSSIRDNYHFFHDHIGNGQWCNDDALAYPLYNQVTTAPKVEEGPVYYDQVTEVEPPYCVVSDYDKYTLRKEFHFETYGFEVLPFVTSPSLDASGECYDLEVKITLEPSCDCKVYEEPYSIDWNENSDNEYLHFWVLGYPDVKEELDKHGDLAVLIEERALSAPTAGTEIDFSIPCFGTRFQSVVILSSLTEISPSDDDLIADIIPFKYSYKATPSSLDIQSNVSLPESGDLLCVDEWVTVPNGVTATILPGTEVWFADPDVVYNNVGFKVEGTLNVGDATGERTQMASASASAEWDGITVVSGGELNIESTDIRGIKEVEASPGMCCGSVGEFDLADVDIIFSNTANGLLLDKANTASLDDVTLRNTPFVSLRNANFLNSKVYMEQDPSGVAVEVLGTSTLDNVVIYDAYTALKVPDGNVTLHDVSAEAGQWAGLTLKLGLLASETGVVDAENCTFLGFNRGVVAEDDAQITLRTSEVKGTACGVYASGNTQVDLGETPIGQEGDNCIDGSTYKVCNLSSNTVPARLNYWYEQNPDPSDFYGNVDYWQEYHTECPTGSGGPDFLIAPGGYTQASGLAAFPNPFNPSCTIKFTLPAGEVSCELAIFDIAGRRVATLFEGESDGKQHEIEWSGRMDSGGRAGSGVYLLSLRTGNKVENAKLVLVH